MRGIQQSAKESRRVHQLQPCRFLHRPAAHQQQGSQAARIQLLDFGNIEHQYADTFELLAPAPELVKRCPAHHASRAVYDRHILQAFDLKLEVHMSIDTDHASKKFRDLLSLNWTWGKGKSHQRKSSWRTTDS